ncbi:MAG: hypothetical protein ABFD64_11680 [Armatimonadota bacterium]
MNKRNFIIFLVLVFFAGSVSALADPFWQRIGSGLSVSGTKTYTLQSLSVNGSEDMFLDDNYGFNSRYLNETNLTVTGNIWSGLSITAALSNNRWNPSDRSVVLNYNKGPTRAAIGDISASLTGNDLIPFSKQLKGATITQDFGVCSVTAIASRTKAATKTVTIAGNNTPGPYYLGVTQIVDGSERVKIDEKEITRSDSTGMPNYTLDAFSGILTFRDDLIVPSTSTINISFESQSYNTTAGTIYGFRSDVPIKKDTGVGFTYLTQSSDSNSDKYQEITESFHGNNSLGLQYELLYIPIEGSVIVKVDGILQSPVAIGSVPADYSIDYPQHYILFTRAILSSSTILVTYVPKPDNAVSGDRNVMGVDAKVKLSDALTLTGQFARSSSGSAGTDGSGSASSLKASGKYGKFEYSAGLKDIDAGYSPVESAGFFRNERGGDINVKYWFNDQLYWNTKIERFHRADSSSTDDTTTSGLSLLSTQTTNVLEWKPENLPELKFSRTRSDSEGLSDKKDSLSTDALTMNWGKKKLNLNGELSRSDRDYTYLSSTDNSLVTTSNTVDTSRLGLRYTPGEKVSFSADISKSNVTNSSGSGSDAKNYQMTASYMPSTSVNLSASYRITDSGGVTSSVISNSEGYVNDIYVNSYSSKSATRIMSAGWTPTKYFSFNTSFNYTSSEGENSTNTSVTGTDFGFTYTPSEIIKIFAHSSKQDGSFVGSSGDMSSRIGFLTLSVGPVKTYSLDLNYQKMLSGTQLSNLSTDDPLYAYQNSAVDLKSISGNLRKEIGGGRYLFTEFLNSSTAGITSSRKNTLAFGMEYPLNSIFGLKVDWRMIDYKDSKNDANNYRANMLNAQIGARFR